MTGLLTDETGELLLDDFLLWPPDLFALTSKILSLSGAYTNVIAPPPNKPWPPKNIPYVENLPWQSLMQYLGQKWRVGLELIPGRFESFEEYFKHFNNISPAEKRRQEIAALQNDKILPGDIIFPFWERLKKTLWPEAKGTINDFQCIFPTECPNKEIDCNERKVERCENCDLWDSFEALISLHAIADEACSGWGIRTCRTMDLPYFPEKCAGKAQEFAQQLLREYGTLATINNARGRILPKRHTPDTGITLRSMSSNLAYHNSSVKVKWQLNFENRNKIVDKFSIVTNQANAKNKNSGNNNSLSILLFPWPFDLRSTDFANVPNPNINTGTREIEFFSYEPKGNSDFTDVLQGLIKEALKETDHIDLVILPESSLSEKEIINLENTLRLKTIPAYITGKRSAKENNHFRENLVRFNMIDNDGLFTEKTSVDQNKHHRWKLTHSQIVKYSLGHVLTPNKDWWEAINVKRREVNFINIGEELTICPLICEDLARQDPIADLIRTVGPSLVVTILMDGPQILERWSARYASVLAEDPGCAVITLSSLGMVNRHQSSNHKPSNSIALINDSEGKTIEINLKGNAKGALINLCLKPKKETLADGRTDHTATNSLIVGAVHQLVI